jgi:hypothetical protein
MTTLVLLGISSPGRRSRQGHRLLKRFPEWDVEWTSCEIADVGIAARGMRDFHPRGLSGGDRPNGCLSFEIVWCSKSLGQPSGCVVKPAGRSTAGIIGLRTQTRGVVALDCGLDGRRKPFSLTASSQNLVGHQAIRDSLERTSLAPLRQDPSRDCCRQRKCGAQTLSASTLGGQRISRPLTD